MNAIQILSLIILTQLGCSTANAEDIVAQTEGGVRAIQEITGGGKSYHNLKLAGPFLVEGKVGKVGILRWELHSDARSNKPSKNSKAIPLVEYFDSVEAKKCYVKHIADNIKHGNRIKSGMLPVERLFEVKQNTAYLTQTINFEAKWGHMNVAFPRTDIFICGVIKADAKLETPMKK